MKLILRGKYKSFLVLEKQQISAPVKLVRIYKEKGKKCSYKKLEFYCQRTFKVIK